MTDKNETEADMISSTLTRPESTPAHLLDPPGAPGLAAAASSASLLFIDDEPAIRTLMEVYFRRQGFEVTTASEMEEAEALLRLRHYELLVTDLGLTALDRLEGLQIVREARYRWPRLRVVVMTGKADPKVRDECLGSGADVYLIKPQPLAEIHRVVAALLAGEAS
jgi:two-component system, OmpR family, phosphate regulon response regulator OmpR